MAREKPEDSFWKVIDSLMRESELVIDRPKGLHHPRFSELIYPVDYGYLKNTLRWMAAVLMSGAVRIVREKSMLFFALLTCARRTRK